MEKSLIFSKSFRLANRILQHFQAYGLFFIIGEKIKKIHERKLDISLICYGYVFFGLYNAPFQITVLVRFSSVWFSLVTVLLIVCPRSLLLCPFHKKLRIWWKKSFDFCQTDNPGSCFMMYCYSTDLNVYTWVELTYQNRQVFWIQFLT